MAKKSYTLVIRPKSKMSKAKAEDLINSTLKFYNEIFPDIVGEMKLYEMPEPGNSKGTDPKVLKMA